MKLNKKIWILFFTFFVFSIAVYGNLESYTISGKITDSFGNPLYNAKVFLYSTVGNCQCKNELPDYTSSTGQYSSAVDNLVFINDCNIFKKGDPCAVFIDEKKDKLWIEVYGYTVLPKPFDNTETKKETWDSYEKKGTVYYDVNLALPNLEKEKEEKIIEERRNYDDFWATPGVIAIINKNLSQPEIDNIKVEFTNDELKEILGKDLAEQIIKNMLVIKTETKKYHYDCGWFILTLAFLVLVILFFSGLKERRNK